MVLNMRWICHAVTASYCCLCLVYGSSANAGEWNAFPKTKAEISILPLYCQVRFNSDQKSAEYRAWMSRLKGGFVHIHHYCAAQHELNVVNREGYTRPKMSQEFLNRAIKQCEYMEEQSMPGFVLMPEILVFKGNVYRRLGRDADAIVAYAESIQLNSKYTPAYMRLADMYYDMGDKEESLSIIEKGLKQVPGSKGLKRRLEKVQ